MREEHQKAMAEERKGGLEGLGNYGSSCVLVGDFFWEVGRFHSVV